MVRGGTAVVRNSQLIMTNNGNASETIFLNDGKTNGWKDGNNVPHGALIVGDWSNSYSYTASCSLENTQIMTTRTNWNRALIVLAQDAGYETLFNYDNKSNISEKDYVICNYAVSGLKKGQISVNGVVVQQREQ